MVKGGNWGELEKEVVRRERVDDEFTPIIRDAANVMLEPEKHMKRVFRGVPAKELRSKLSTGASRSRQKQRRGRTAGGGGGGASGMGKLVSQEMDTAAFLAAWDSQRPASVRPQAQQQEQPTHISPSGMAFHLQQGYTLQFAMGDGMLADGVASMSPYDRQEAVDILQVGAVADKFFEPRPPPSPRPRPPPNTADSRYVQSASSSSSSSPYGSGQRSSGTRMMSPRQRKLQQERSQWSSRGGEEEERGGGRGGGRGSNGSPQSQRSNLRARRKKKNEARGGLGARGQGRNHRQRWQEEDQEEDGTIDARGGGRKVLNLRQVKSSAASKIQALYRGNVTRDSMDTLWNETNAACLIQCAVRGKAVRLEISELHEAAVCIQAHVRGGVARKRARKRRGGRNGRRGRSQSYRNNRGRPKKKVLTARERKGAAATKIQAMGRGHIARCLVDDLVEEMEAAALIQSHIRGKAVRLEHQEMNQAATVIAAHTRGNLARKGFKPDPNYRKVPRKKKARPGAALKQPKRAVARGGGGGAKNEAATKIQAVGRGHIARCLVDDLEEDMDAATLIQSQIRGKAVRLEHQEMNEAASTIQRHERGRCARANVKLSSPKITTTSAAPAVDGVRCLAVHAFEGSGGDDGDDDDLHFSQGEYLIALDTSEDWWEGYVEGNPSKTGFFPHNYVKKV